MTTFLDRLARLAATRGHATAIRGAAGRMTFADLRDRVMDRAARLQAAGVRPGQVLAVTLADEPEHLVVALSLLALGTWQINAASHEVAATRVELARRVGATLQLSDTPAADIPGLAVIRWLPDGTAGRSPAAVPAREGGAFLSTSATTGRQSIVRLDEPRLVRRAARRCNQPGESLFEAAPIEFGHAKRARLFAMWCGAENVFRPRGAGSLSAWLAQGEVTIADLSRVNLTSVLSDHAAPLPASMALRAEGSAIPFAMLQAVIARVTRNFHVRYAPAVHGQIPVAAVELKPRATVRREAIVAAPRARWSPARSCHATRCARS